MKAILKHFSLTDPRIFLILSSMDIQRLKVERDQSLFFQHLVNAIVSQQLSVKVSEVIIERLNQLFPEHTVLTPKLILSANDDQLRGIGMSWGKVKYVKDLADKTQTGELQLSTLSILDNEDVITKLTKVKRIGLWTAEMYLIFHLGREDVFSFGDLGLRRAIEKIYELPKDVAVKKIEPIVEKWQPYRSYASLALWYSLDNQPKS